MLKRRLIALVAVLLLLAAGCTTSKPVKGSEERPQAPQVAKEAGDAADQPDDDLVLYSSSMEKAELETGADEAEDEDQAEDKKQEVPEQVEVSVTSEGAYAVGEQTYTEVPALLEALERLAAETPTSSMSIRAVAETPDESIVDLITAARRAGFTNIEVRVEGEEPEAVE